MNILEAEAARIQRDEEYRARVEVGRRIAEHRYAVQLRLGRMRDSHRVRHWADYQARYLTSVLKAKTEDEFVKAVTDLADDLGILDRYR